MIATVERECPPQPPAPPDDGRLRALLLGIRQGLIIMTRAIEVYLGIGPSRSER